MTALPLLAKELTEIAARRRTYITRVVYAVLLFLFFTLLNESTLRNASANPFNSMGSGERMFFTLLFLQIIGIHLFLSAMACGLITQENERDSLVLLFLTELTPWQIVLQKYASGLVAIFSFLLIGMPLAGLCYAYGGISPETLFTGVYALVLTCLHVAAFSLMCSARARTTVGAFMGTYVGLTALFFGLGLTGELVKYLNGSSRQYPEIILTAFPFTILLQSSRYSFLRSSSPGIADILVDGLPSVGATVVFLLIARFYFVRRAFAPARNRLLGFFRWLDAWMHRANRFVGNVTFHTRDRTLPEDDPIAWREMTRRSLGRPQYLVRVLVALEIPTIALSLWAFVAGGSEGGFSALAAVLGTLAVLILSATAVNAFVSERVNQTFEVLLTTPLTAAAIVRQKAQMLSRFMWVLAVPVMTVFSFHWWINRDWPDSNSWNARLHEPTLYLACAALSLAIYLPLVKWLSLWIGLKMRTRFRAILTALGVIVGWCALPLIFASTLNVNPRGLGRVLYIVSPLSVPAWNEMSDLRELFGDSPLGGLVATYSAYALILLLIRHRCLSRADAYLRG